MIFLALPFCYISDFVLFGVFYVYVVICVAVYVFVVSTLFVL